MANSIGSKAQTTTNKDGANFPASNSVVDGSAVRIVNNVPDLLADPSVATRVDMYARLLPHQLATYLVFIEATSAGSVHLQRGDAGYAQRMRVALAQIDAATRAKEGARPYPFSPPSPTSPPQPGDDSGRARRSMAPSPSPRKGVEQAVTTPRRTVSSPTKTVHKRKADHELASGDKVDGPPNKKLQAAATGSNASADPITVRTPGASVSTSISDIHRIATLKLAAKNNKAAARSRKAKDLAIVMSRKAADAVAKIHEIQLALAAGVGEETQLIMEMKGQWDVIRAQALLDEGVEEVSEYMKKLQ